MQVYHYVGPRYIAQRAPLAPAGTLIRSQQDVIQWARTTDQRIGPDGVLIATYVVSQSGELLIADRRSEHVACAGRQPVKSAGEITFQLHDSDVEVVEVSNQSTGYCPEPESWSAVEAAIVGAGMKAPARFELECVFRRCPSCQSINLIKQQVFRCAICGGTLPQPYNCQQKTT